MSIIRHPPRASSSSLAYQHIASGQVVLVAPWPRPHRGPGTSPHVGRRPSGVWVLPTQERAHHIDAGLGAENAPPPGVGGEIVNESLQGDVGEPRIL